MRCFPKRKDYGSYKTSKCPFCQRTGTFKNSQGLDVCKQHVESVLEEIKCTCKGWLEPRSGKFGPYFHCENCGNFNYEKGMKIKELTTPIKLDEPESKPINSVNTPFPQKTSFHQKKPAFSKSKPKEITITSNDLEYFN